MTTPNERNLSERISDDIINYILKEQLNPGDRLPNESILAEKLGVGRSSIREAVKLLASRNIVTVRQGSGTYVSSNPGIVKDPLGFTFIGDKNKLAADLLEIRFLLEPAIAARAAANATEEEIRQINRLCSETEQLLREGKDHTAKDIEFHTAIGTSSKNLAVPRLMPVITFAVPLFIDLTQNVLRQETIDTHREIAEAIAAHDPTRAHDAMYLHLIHNRRLITAQTQQ